LALISLSASRKSVVAACRVESSRILQVYDEIKVSLLLIVSVLDKQSLSMYFLSIARELCPAGERTADFSALERPDGLALWVECRSPSAGRRMSAVARPGRVGRALKAYWNFQR
jgi:hypothetical protein